jgi:hypothetical protein
MNSLRRARAKLAESRRSENTSVKDFFISYTSRDRSWAEWIAWHLEEEKFSVVIQAWDFVGNWIVKMDTAMQETERTIAVLSPHYLEAMFTQSEWAAAFRRDPTGKRDLLIPVRVEPVEPQGILGQIVYVDLVGRNEKEGLELLLKRILGLRGKPDVRPDFPGVRSIAVRPVYPAAAEDQQKLLQAREAVVRWRSIYGGKIDALRAAGELSRKWSRERPSEFNDEIAGVISFGAAVARDFRDLPVSKLEFGRPYGLSIHPTVFWGQAIDDVTSTARTFTPEAKANSDVVNARMVELGMEPRLFMPEAYGFEMLARVLESALELARFNVERLPRGYLKDSASEVPNDLSQYRTLLVARIDRDPKLHLLSADQEVRSIGSFSARTLDLHVLCAQRNRQGSIDLIAHDWSHLYYWQSSSQLPAMQFTPERTIEEARFLSSEPGSPVATVDSYGTVETITPDGRSDTLYRPPRDEHLQSVRIWVDPLDRSSWYVLTLAGDGSVASGLHGVPSLNRPADDLWNDPLFVTENGSPSEIYWQGLRRDMVLGTLDGLPCLVVTRIAPWGAGVCFLDPKTLLSIRRPLVIREFVGDLSIAGGRWLLAALLKDDNQPHHRLLLWDLDSDSGQPAGGWFEEAGDVYFPIVTAERVDSFQTVQVFRTLELPPHENFFQLVRFAWPPGKITLLQRYQDLRIWPVADESEQ